jgi:S-adenosylmethionine:tRNA ribosyltransferase-isomerase
MNTPVAESFERLNFDLPRELEASEPPEERGLRRDAVRMLVAHTSTGVLESTTFDHLPTSLDPGDLVVVNTSATIPAALDAVTPDGVHLLVHLSTRLDADRWAVEFRHLTLESHERWRGAPPNRHLALRGHASLDIEGRYDDHRLWVARVNVGGDLIRWLETHGRPIQYGYAPRRWPLSMYQNVYAGEPGSAEMPSAGRPFTNEVLTALMVAGIRIAPLVLHTGVASLEANELPFPERLKVPAPTAHAVNDTRREGHRVIAVGTTVVRALETAADDDGLVQPYEGWTDLVVTPDRELMVIDGMLTGWHEPVSSHLLMLEAVAGSELLRDSYDAALTLGFHWHEFGDSHLIIP